MKKGCWLDREYANDEWTIHVENKRRRQRPIYALTPTFVHVFPDGNIVVNQMLTVHMRTGRRGEKLKSGFHEDRYLTVQEAMPVAA